MYLHIFHGKMSDIAFTLPEENSLVSPHIVSLENCFDALSKLNETGSIYAWTWGEIFVVYYSNSSLLECQIFRTWIHTIQSMWLFINYLIWGVLNRRDISENIRNTICVARLIRKIFIHSMPRQELHCWFFILVQFSTKNRIFLEFLLLIFGF